MNIRKLAEGLAQALSHLPRESVPEVVMERTLDVLADSGAIPRETKTLIVDELSKIEEEELIAFLG